MVIYAKEDILKDGSCVDTSTDTDDFKTLFFVFGNTIGTLPTFCKLPKYCYMGEDTT